MTRQRSAQKFNLPNQVDLILLITATTSWLALAFIIFKVDPVTLQNIPFQNSYLIFFILLLTAMINTTWLLSKHPVRTTIWTVSIFSVFLLGLHQLANFLNIGLFVSLLLATEFYFRFKQSHYNKSDQ